MQGDVRPTAVTSALWCRSTSMARARSCHAHVTPACPAPLCSSVVVKCLNSEKLGQRKNMNLPGVIVDLPTVTKKDADDLENFGATRGVDFIAASFVRKGTDIGTPCAAQLCAWPTLCRQCSRMRRPEQTSSARRWARAAARSRSSPRSRTRRV